MSSGEPTLSPGRGVRFSLKTLLLLPLLVAAGVFVWSRYIYEHPAHSVPSYEQAPYARSLSVKLAPNTFAIERVMRPDREGTVLVENGKGKSLKLPAAHPVSALKSSAAWLDSAQIDLTSRPGTCEVIEVRIFDHATRMPLNEEHDRTGWRMADASTLQIHRLGGLLPETLDIWLRLHSYAPSDPILKIAPSAGSAGSIDTTSFTVEHIAAGQMSVLGGIPQPGVPNDHETSLMLKIEGEPGTPERYQLAAVAEDGARALMRGAPHFLRGSGDTAFLQVSMGLEDIAHLEIRPFGGRKRFFFDGIQLPRVTVAPTAAPPTASFQFTGDKWDHLEQAFAPLRVRFRLRAGERFSGLGGNDSGMEFLSRPNGAENTESRSTLTYRIEGLANLNPRFETRETDDGGWQVLPTAGSRSSGYNSWSQIGFQTLPMPQEGLGILRVTLE